MFTEQTLRESGVDLPELLARVEYDRELLREVYEIFEEEFPRLHQHLRDSMNRGDMKSVQVAAHTMKGMLASLSFSRATASALRIERMATQSATDGISEELVRLERNAAIAQQALGTVCREVIC